VSKTKQADGEIHEDQLLNFLVNRLDEEVSLSLANNAEITAEDIYEALVGACADGTSVSTLCASSQNSPAGNTVLYHLRTKFEPSVILSSRPSVQPLRHRTQAAETASRGCFVRY
jgi:putative transposase